MRNTAPADGLSHPLHPVPRAALRLVNRAVMGVFYRTSVEGEGEIPKSGPVVICPTHQSPWDATLVDTLTTRDVRYMAAEEQFVGLRGQAMTWGGAFPVDRGNPGSTPLRHSMEVLKEKKALCMFPEGGIIKTGQVGTLKGGVGRIAATTLEGAIAPIAIRLQADDQARPVERVLGYAASAAFVGLGVTAALCGGPFVRTLAGTVTGAMAGAWAMGHAGAATTPATAHPAFGRLLRGMKFAAVGLAAGAVAGALGSSLPAVGLATSLCSGGAAVAVANHMRTRPLARFHIGTLIQVAPYVAKYGKKGADEHIVADLQQALIDGRTALGQPPPALPAAQPPAPQPAASPAPQPAAPSASQPAASTAPEPAASPSPQPAA